MQEETLWEAFRAPSVIFLYMSLLLSFCVVSGAELGDRVELEFQGYRLQNYEVAGNFVGSKTFKVMYEAVSIEANALRRTTVASWRDLVSRDLTPLLSTGMGALLIVLPPDIATLSPADRKLFAELETSLATITTELAVYGIPWSEAAVALLGDVDATSPAASGAAQLLHAVTANTFMLSSTTTTSATPAPLPNTAKNVVARLSGAAPNSPTILFIAHYDTHAVFPDLGNGSDSNGSGVAGLLELLAVMKKYYEKPSTRPNYHMVFVWTAAGKHNYQGTRAFVDDLVDKYPDEKVELAICLDTIGRGNALNVHVSKMPSETSAIHRFVRHLRFAAPNQSIEIITKKISLQNPQFAWEHERLNVKRLPGITLSALPNHEEILRRTLTDGRADAAVVTRNVRAIAEAVLAVVLQLPEKSAALEDPRVSADSTLLAPEAVSGDRVTAMLAQFARTPRPITNPTATEETAMNIEAVAKTYTQTRTQIVHLETPLTVMAVERIVAEKTKPALFDLLLAGVIAAYLAVIMKVVSHAQPILDTMLVILRKKA